MEWKYQDYSITDDKRQVDVNKVHHLLSTTYWAAGRTRQQVQESLKHSMCFSVFKDDEQVGFGRVVTDYVLFAWIADIVIDPEHQGKGIGKYLMSVLVGHPQIPQNMQLLRTKDAHELYEKYGFERQECMVRRSEKTW
jgi:GNAT superfamily N-acetyltransferase